MATDNFFNESKDQSRVKAEIVSDYFGVWAKVIMSTAKKVYAGKIAYIDLYAGPGRYVDGTASTPLRVLERAIEDKDMRSMLVTMFNDIDTDNVGALRSAIDSLPGIKTLRYEPQISNLEVNEETAKTFEGTRLVPTLFFVDPWGYKGLSLRLVNSVLKDWGCDCIFFFNYNRINMGLENPAVAPHMNAIFGGKERADALRNRLDALESSEREPTIVNDLVQALKAGGRRFVLSYRFKNDEGTRTSHHLIFATKDFKGYHIMKGIMARHSSSSSQGVASFEYNPAAVRQPKLFETSRPLDELKDRLVADYAGRRQAMRQIYEEHSIDTPYTDGNYKDALKQLEAEGRITADPPAAKRPKRKGETTFGDKVLVTFPKKK